MAKLKVKQHGASLVVQGTKTQTTPTHSFGMKARDEELRKKHAGGVTGTKKVPDKPKEKAPKTYGGVSEAHKEKVKDLPPGTFLEEGPQPGAEIARYNEEGQPEKVATGKLIEPPPDSAIPPKAGDSLADEMDARVEESYRLIWELARLLGFDLEQIRVQNIAKLRGVRYEHGFTAEAANNRDLDAERTALENTQK